MYDYIIMIPYRHKSANILLFRLHAKHQTANLKIRRLGIFQAIRYYQRIYCMWLQIQHVHNIMCVLLNYNKLAFNSSNRLIIDHAQFYRNCSDKDKFNHNDSTIFFFANYFPKNKQWIISSSGQCIYHQHSFFFKFHLNWQFNSISSKLLRSTQKQFGHNIY